MKDAIGGSMLLYLVVFFVGIIVLFFTGILAYTKAYKAKNRVIEVIETNYNCNSNDSIDADAINDSLAEMGYQLGECPISTEKATDIHYKVCISQKQAENGKYYKVTTYVHFDIPVIGDSINIPVSGETKTLCKNYNY